MYGLNNAWYIGIGRVVIIAQTFTPPFENSECVEQQWNHFEIYTNYNTSDKNKNKKNIDKATRRPTLEG